MKNKILNWQTLFTVILAVILISITIFVIDKEKKEIASQEPEKIYVGYESEQELDNFSREGAVTAMKDLLKSIGDDVGTGERTVEERMEALDNGETDLEEVINENTIDKLYLSEDFKKNKFNRQFAASVLLTYHQLISETTQSKEFTPLIDTFDEIVYLDNKLMTAQIPLDIFTGENRGIAFEMQYLDGEWKFNPYTSMMSLVMIINYENQIEQMFKNNAAPEKTQPESDVKSDAKSEEK